LIVDRFEAAIRHRDFGDAEREAAACRDASALFDFSFMSRARVEGPEAAALVQELTPRPIADMRPGQIRYALCLDANQCVVADITVWRIAEAVYEVFSGRETEIVTLLARASEKAAVRNLTEETAILALQGPLSRRVLATVAPVDALRALPYFSHMDMPVAGVSCRVGRLGYTGERGFEIVAPWQARDKLWARLLASQARPGGFAAADMLRIEAGFPLFANEFRARATPLELGLARFAPPSVPMRQPWARLACFRAKAHVDPVLWRPPARVPFPPPPGAVAVTSACRSLAAKEALLLGYVSAQSAGEALRDPTLSFSALREVGLPFFDPLKRRPRGGWNDQLESVG
jgi:folate-binding Fe-S cluster repair protein YgfZ